MTTENEVVEGIKVSAASTLKLYGLTRDDFRTMLFIQDYVCAVCSKKPVCGDARCKTMEPHGHFHVHHNHVKGWKKMTPELRRRHVVALVCQFCNRFVLARMLTLRKARNIVTMLERGEEWWLT